MIRIILLIIIIFLCMNGKLKEGNETYSCCGGVDPTDSSEDAPLNIKRCLKNEAWSPPCTTLGSENCCEGRDMCLKSPFGGKCRYRSGGGFYVYKDGRKVELSQAELESEKEQSNLQDQMDKIVTDSKDSKTSLWITLGILSVFIVIMICIIVYLVMENKLDISKMTLKN